MFKTTTYKVLFERNYQQLLSCVKYPSNTDPEEKKIVQSVLLSLAHFDRQDVQLIAKKTGRNESEILSLLHGCRFLKKGGEPSPLFHILHPPFKPSSAVINLTEKVHEYLTETQKNKETKKTTF